MNHSTLLLTNYPSQAKWREEVPECTLGSLVKASLNLDRFQGSRKSPHRWENDKIRVGHLSRSSLTVTQGTGT